MKIIDIINQSSILFVAVIGSFVIFRMHWLRLELDDYRGRIIDLICRDAGDFKLDYCKDIKIYYDNQFGHLEKQIAIKIKNFEKNKTFYYGLSDGLFDFILKKTIEIGDESGKLKMSALEDMGINLEDTYNLFTKRYNHKKWVLGYLLFSFIVLVGSFLLTYLSISGVDLPFIVNNLIYKLAYLFFILIDFVLLYFLIRNDN
jgi:hypothetical protein